MTTLAPRGKSIAGCILCLHLVMIGGQLYAEERAKQPERQPALKLVLLDVQGRPHDLSPASERSAQVFIFTSTECPIANGYVPELNRLYRAVRAGDSQVDFYSVISDRSISRAAAEKHAREYQIEYPVLFDASGDLAAHLKPTHTPEAFVLNRQGAVVYRGRIDDIWADLGKRKAQATRHDLKDAIAATVSGKPVPAERTEPVGCLFEEGASGSEKAVVTYNRDIAPIIHGQCMNCHRTGEVAPFPLTNHAEVAKRAGQIVRVTQSRFMPPWRAEPEFGHFLGERRLTDQQLAVIKQWAESGTPVGDPADLPPAPKFAEGWLLGEPDLIVKMPEPFELRADGRDEFRNFVIPLNVDQDRLVAAVEFRPGNRRIVHHAIFYLDSNGAARKRDEADPGPGYGSFGGPGINPTGAIGGWAPGGTPRFLPDNMGRYLRKGSDLVLQIHYHPSGKQESDQSTIGIHFVKSASNKAVAGIMVADRSLDIPAGAAEHRMTGQYTLPNDVTMVGIVPHMHLLGRDMRAVAKLPDGTTVPLIWIKDWNFNWQDQYLFAEPLRFPKGTKLEVAAVYDNSADNELNPNSPPRRVRWGEQTTDEMFICFFLVNTDDPKNLIPLIVNNLIATGQARFAAEGLFQRKPAK
jgi:hypothetical protein